MAFLSEETDELQVEVEAVHTISTAGMLRVLGARSSQVKILVLLRIRQGAWNYRNEISEYVWGDREDGGSEYNRQCIAVHVLRLRRAGFDIRSGNNSNYMLPPSDGLGEAVYAYSRTFNSKPLPASFESTQDNYVYMIRTGKTGREYKNLRQKIVTYAGTNHTQVTVRRHVLGMQIRVRKEGASDRALEYILREVRKGQRRYDEACQYK